MVVPDLEAIVREYLGEKPFGELSEEWKCFRRPTG
jgi:hypothetical protein